MNKEFIEDLMYTVMDCIEDSIGSISIVKGRRMLEAFIVCLLIEAFSVLGVMLKFPVFIQWYNALPACIITGYLAFMETINSFVTKGISKSLKAVREKKEVFKHGR